MPPSRGGLHLPSRVPDHQQPLPEGPGQGPEGHTPAGGPLGHLRHHPIRLELLQQPLQMGMPVVAAQQPHQGPTPRRGHQPGKEPRRYPTPEVDVNLVRTGRHHLGLDPGGEVPDPAQAQLPRQLRAKPAGHHQRPAPQGAPFHLVGQPHTGMVPIYRYVHHPVAQQVPGPRPLRLLREGCHVRHPVHHVGPHFLRPEVHHLPSRSHHPGPSGVPVHQGAVDGEPLDAFSSHDAGAQLVADPVPPVHHRYAVAQAGQPVGHVVAGRPGSDHYHVLQVPAPPEGLNLTASSPRPGPSDC